MRFKKGNRYGFTSEDPFAKDPVCVKVKPGIRERLRNIPGWQDKLRDAIDGLLESSDPS